MIKKVKSLQVSEKIINRLIEHKAFTKINCYIECYQNGREQGFAISGFKNVNKSITFSQYRCSDTIVVYCGESALQTISEDAWKNSKHFLSYPEAVNYIIKKAKEYNNI